MEDDRDIPEPVDEASPASDLSKQERDELFQKRVQIVGDLHTQRALWANRVGELKSQANIHRQQHNETFEDLVRRTEEAIGEISKEITEFSPQSVDDLERFKSEIEERFERVGELYQQAYDEESSILPDDLDAAR